LQFLVINSMKKLLLSFIITVLFVPCFLYAHDGTAVRYFVDLNAVTDDILLVSAEFPPLTVSDSVVVFPASAPGTYDQLDFGRFVLAFTAYDKNNKIVESKRSSVNTFRLLHPEKVSRIEYALEDTWDEKTENRKKRLFNPGGSNFQKDTCFALNYFAICAYIPRYKRSPVNLTIKRPDFLKGVSSLPLISETKDTDIYTAEDYDYLADNPALYARNLDTTVLTIRGAKVTVAVYSETNKIGSKRVAETIKPVISANADFLGKMPVNRYSFLFVFASSPQNSGDGNNGALEHSYSSMYYLPESDNYSFVEGLIKHTASHEFLHIKIPLHLHSKEIDDFDFLNPKMSKHLWLYEGVTEYFAHLSQIPLSGEEVFIKQIRQKIMQMDYFRKDVSLTELAVKVMEPDMQKVYPMIYDRGALIAMMMDIRLRELSGGKKTLPWLVDTLSVLYGRNKPFDDNELFPKIIELTKPEMQGFIDSFIVTSSILPLKQTLHKIGYDYDMSREVEGYKFENVTIRFVTQEKILLVPKSPDNALGVVEGDEIVAADGVEMKPETMSQVIGKILKPKTDAELSVTVKRNGENKVLKAKPVKTVITENHAVNKSETLTAEQQQFASWIFGNAKK